MRRKGRYIATAAAATAGVFVLVEGLIQYFELKDKNLPFWENLNKERLLKIGGAAAIVGGIGGWGFYEYQKDKERLLPFCPDHYLKDYLSCLSVENSPELLEKGKILKEDIKDFLLCSYGDLLVVPPKDFGSIPKRTAIVTSFDFDILLAFQKKSFGNLKDMYHDVYDVIGNEYSKRGYQIRKQKRSLGLLIEDGEHEIQIDIVPGREVNDFKVDNNLTLYEHPSFFWQQDSYVKTNFNKKRKVTTNKPVERKMIMLFKDYKISSGFNLSSTAIQNLVLEAFQKNGNFYSSSLLENFKHSLDYISYELSYRKKVKDVANSNLNLISKLSTDEKKSIVNLMSDDLEKLEKDSNYIKEIFEI